MDDPDNPFLVSETKTTGSKPRNENKSETSISTTRTTSSHSSPPLRQKRSRKLSQSSDRFIGQISQTSKAKYNYTTSTNPYITPQKRSREFHGESGSSEGSDESFDSAPSSVGSSTSGSEAVVSGAPQYVELCYATPADDKLGKADHYTTRISNAIGLDSDERSVLQFSSPRKKGKSWSMSSPYLTTSHVPSNLADLTSSPSSASRLHSRQREDLERIMNTPTKKGNRKAESFLPLDLASPSRVTRSPSQTPKRIISTRPELVLDAPQVGDDYYTQLLDWSSKNVVMVSLDRKCYLWSKSVGILDSLYESPEDDHITACKFSHDGDLALISTYEGAIGLFDVSSFSTLQPPVKPLNTLEYEPICSITWVQPVSYALGDTTGHISLFDVRSNPLKPKLVMDSQNEAFVVGLSASHDDVYLASGLNNGKAMIWDLRKTSKPLHILDNHKSAVRALQWCPWQHNLLASGGGYLDGKICLINGDNGKVTKTVETGSQVCQLLWSRHYRELLSSHSSESDQFIFWHYPTMNRLVSIVGHEGRPLHLKLSPDGSTVASLAGDETLKFWKWFDIKAGQKPLKAMTDRPITDLFSSSIR